MMQLHSQRGVKLPLISTPLFDWRIQPQIPRVVTKIRVDQTGNSLEFR